VANYSKHLSWGIGWGAIAGLGSLLTGTCTIMQSVVAMTLGIIGAILPDIDSDTSRPVRIIFGIMGIVMPVLIMQLFLDDKTKTETLFCYMLFAYLIVQHGVSKVFFKFTRHRGVFHSIPAVVICGLLTFLAFANSTLPVKTVFAVACAGGYMAHLILDEIYSVDLAGLRVKNSFGTAICFKSESRLVTSLAYLIIIVLGCFVLLTL
jgi:membrane-bound metal-dependent hydrolase YbcI (DUF457 family)